MGREEESRRIIVICLLAALLVAGAAFFLYHGFSEEKEEPLPVTDLSQKETSQRTLLVYVTGAVRQPGVYELFFSLRRRAAARDARACSHAGDALSHPG